MMLSISTPCVGEAVYTARHRPAAMNVALAKNAGRADHDNDNQETRRKPSREMSVSDKFAHISRRWFYAFASSSILLLVIQFAFNLYMKYSVMFSMIMAVGLFAILSAITNEMRGEYRARVVIVYKKEQPEKFRRNTLMLLTVGCAIFSFGAACQIAYWWLAP